MNKLDPKRRRVAVPRTHVANEFAPWFAALRVWLVAGCAACLLIPDARGVDAWFGWLPFWLIVAPALDLVVLRHRQLAGHAKARELAAWLARLARRRAARRQARPLPRRHSRVRSNPRATESGTLSP